MIYFYISVGVLLFLAAAALLTSYICFRMVFLENRKAEEAKRKNKKDDIPTPDGDEYEPYRDKIREKIREARALPYEEMEITSFDGLKLRGRYYESIPGAPIELMMHGYRGSSERDLSAGIFRAFKVGRNALLVDHRASGRSEGRVITFGALEKRDCMLWIDHMIARFGDDVRIVLTGISMGAATVMMCSAEKLPKNVVGVLADCGYTSAEAIIKKVIRDMKLPADILYPFVRLGARIFGKFNVDEADALSAVAKSRLPIIFIHGEDDGFVPCDMSRENYEACTSEKALVTIPKADHGLCYMIDPEGYISALNDFFKFQ